MSQFLFKSFPQLLSSMAATLSANTPISDFSEGSVALTLLETAAQEDFQQYIQMLNIIRNYNLDTTEGADLDERAAEYGLTRIQPRPHSGFISIIDTRFTKISTKLYAGLPGPTSGSTIIYVDDASGFPASGDIYLGRGTSNSEGPITYSAAPVNNTSYWTITLDTAMLNDHGTDETVILAQYGDRVVQAGTEVQIPESDVSEQVLFEINQTVELLDGESRIDNVLVSALAPGATKVPANSIISFTNPPFADAVVINPLPFVNGKDEETDQQLRDRIRDTIQALAKGTSQSIRTGIVGVIDTDTNQSVVSTKIVPPTTLADGPTKVYIDNGSGLQPSLAPVGLETVLTKATGGETFFQLENFPIAKASLIAQNSEPFALNGGEILNILVGTDEETFTFASTDFRTAGIVKATEIAEAINNRSILIEARTITESNGQCIIINARTNKNEDLTIESGSTANDVLNFSENLVQTLKLYKNDKLLTKDGLTASILSNAQPFNLAGTSVTTADGDITVTPGGRIVTKTIAGLYPFTKFINSDDYIKFSTDADTFYAKVRTVVSDTKLILDEKYGLSGGGTGDLVIWSSPQLEVAANGDQEETEIISFSPNDFANPAQALASEVYARLQKDLNLSESELAVNSTRIKIISDVKNSVESGIQILGAHAGISLGFNVAKPKTGTITTTGSSKVVTGSGTLFTTELEENQWIRVSTDGIGAWTKIETIESDTLLYLVEGYRGKDSSGVAFQGLDFSEKVQGKNEDYVLNRSSGKIELTQALQAGDTITAGSVNTRAFVDSNQQTFDFSTLGSSSTLIVAVDGGLTGTVTTGDASPPYNDFIASALVNYDSSIFVGSYLIWTSGNNVGETDFISTYNPTTGQITTTSGSTNAIVASDTFRICQVLTFNHSLDFADPTLVLASEVVEAINDQMYGGVAELKNSDSVRLRTSNFTEAGAIEVLGGTANNLLGFSTEKDTNENTNTAFVVSGNSDRGGFSGSPGFTLGVDQKLIVVLDADSASKTFAVNMDVKGTATAAGSGTFTSTVIGAKYTKAEYFNDFYVYWQSGALEGSVQKVTSYSGLTGVFNTADVFPTGLGAAAAGDTFALVPRTAENVVKQLNDLGVSTFSISGSAETTGLSGDYVQLNTTTPGSSGKIYVTGGTANKFGITIQSIVAGAPVNDVTVNTVSGLSKGLLSKLSVDGKVTTGDATAPYDTFIDTSMQGTLVNYFTGMNIEFLTGDNTGHKTTIATYNNTTGEITLTTPCSNSIDVNDTYRITKEAVIVDITGTAAPFTVSVNDLANAAIDVSGFTTQRAAAIRDHSGLNFISKQLEGVDGYKYFTGLMQKVQWTIDGLDRDADTYPGIGAAGTQFEVLPPVLVKLHIELKVTPNEGVSLSTISGQIANAVAQYVNSLGVGDDVILSEIIYAAQSVSNVFDVEILNHTTNIIISDGELARLDSSDLVIG